MPRKKPEVTKDPQPEMAKPQLHSIEPGPSCSGEFEIRMPGGAGVKKMSRFQTDTGAEDFPYHELELTASEAARLRASGLAVQPIAQSKLASAMPFEGQQDEAAAEQAAAEQESNP